jgi:hypothetical protein
VQADRVIKLVHGEYQDSTDAFKHDTARIEP